MGVVAHRHAPRVVSFPGTVGDAWSPCKAWPRETRWSPDVSGKASLTNFNFGWGDDRLTDESLTFDPSPDRLANATRFSIIASGFIQNRFITHKEVAPRLIANPPTIRRGRYGHDPGNRGCSHPPVCQRDYRKISKTAPACRGNRSRLTDSAGSVDPPGWLERWPLNLNGF